MTRYHQALSNIVQSVDPSEVVAVATDGMATAGGVSPHPIIKGLLLDIVQKSRVVEREKK
jgi:hypothetical protein